jgi:hypothetical protein
VSGGAPMSFRAPDRPSVDSDPNFLIEGALHVRA